ncbi:MAG: ABC transporter ATP-binding protein [Cellulosilyticaceae bacterium]
MWKGTLFLLKFSWETKKSYIISLAVYQIINSITPLISVIIPKFIIDELLGAKRVSLLLIYIGILSIGLFLGNFISNYLSTKAFLDKTLVFNEFEITLGKKLAMADYKNLEDPNFLDIKEKAYKFLYGDGEGFATVIENLFGIIGKIITFLGIVAVISRLNIFIVIIFIALVLVNSYFDSRNTTLNVKLDLEQAPYERRIMYLSGLLDDFSYGKEMRLGNLQKWIIEQYRKSIKKTYDFYKRSINNTRKSYYFSSFISFIQITIAYIYLTLSVIIGKIGIGDFTMYINAVNLFTNSMQDVMNSLIKISKYAQYYQAVQVYMNMPSTMRESGKIKIDKNEKVLSIQFEHVWFKYDGQSEYIIKDMNTTFEYGKKYSIIGENGAGKTTLIKLLTRLYDPTKGRILLNGKDIKEIDYNSYLELFSAVFQDYKLFSFSLKENIILKNNNEECDEIVEKLLEQTGLSKKIKTLSQGINTAIYKNFDSQGFEPSGGEGQKIILARALYKNSKIIILDEPTSALDARAEYELYKQFDYLVQDKMAIYISHRMSTARFCDEIIVLEKGNIVEQGNHEQLMRLNGLYSELYSMQAQYYV